METLKKDLENICVPFKGENTEEVYDCPECQDSEIILARDENGEWVAKPCKCKERKRLKRLIKNSYLTSSQREMRFENYKPTEKTLEMFLAAKAYVNEFPEIVFSNSNSKGIGLTGSVGIGKTHLLCAIANELLDRKIPVIFVNTTNLIAELYEALKYGLNSADQSYDHDLNAKINAISSAQVVIFDDVGKERITDWVQAQYYRIINNRYVNRLPTCFSSNCNLDEIAEKIGDAVASRLYEMTKGRYFHVEADDFRVVGK